MSASQCAPMRRVRRAPQGASLDGRSSVTAVEGDFDGSMPLRSPAVEGEERVDSVLLSSRSTTSLSKGLTFSSTVRASTNNDAPLSQSPQLGPRHSSGDARVHSSDLSRRLPRAEAADSGDAAAALPPHDGAPPVSATPDKLLAKRLSDATSASPHSQVRASSEGRTGDSQLQPVEESVSFEFYPTRSSQRGSAGGRGGQAAHPAAPAPDGRLLRGVAGAAHRESPTAPSALLRIPIPDGMGQRYLTSVSSRDQHRGGRYEAMSQSSRFEDAHQLSPRPADGDELVASDAVRHRVPLLDDMVRHSTTDSFAAEDAGGQPPRVDVSMNSQTFVRNYKRRHTANVSGGRANGAAAAASGTTGLNARYASISVASTPHASADMAALAAGPELLSSDQLARMPVVQRRQPESTVLGMRLSDTFVVAAASPAPAAPLADEFAIVRAPISGLRAKVLGNAAVDEEEAAEDPEAQALLAQQLETFVSKVVRHHQDGPAPPASSVAEPETRAEILRRANAEAAQDRCGPSPPSAGTPAAEASVAAAESAMEVVRPKRGKKAAKKVRFNLEGLVRRDEEGPNALKMPRHCTSTHDGPPEPMRRPASPPVLVSTGGTPSASAGESDGSPHRRHTSAPVVDVRSLLRAGAGVVGEGVASPTSPTVAASDTASPARSRHRYSATDSANCVSVVSVDDDEGTAAVLRSPGSPMSPAAAVAVAPPSLLLPPAAPAVPVPLPPPATVSASKVTAAAHGTPHKKRKPSAQVRKATKMHRKAAVALVAGASEGVVVPRSSNSSSVQRSQQTMATLGAAGSVLSSMEVCQPEGEQFRLSFSSPTLPPQSTGSGRAELRAPKSLPGTGDAPKPSRRSNAKDRKKAVTASASTASLDAGAPPPPLQAMQVVLPRHPAAVPTAVAFAKPAADGVRAAESRSRGAVGTSSPRSSLSVTAIHPPSKSATLTDLPPLSVFSRSGTSTPDDAAAQSATAPPAQGEPMVLLPRATAAARRSSILPDAMGSSSSVGDGAAAGLRKERSCSTMEFRNDRDVSQVSTVSERSTTREPSAPAHPSKVQVGHIATSMLPRLSSGSLKPHSASLTMPPPSA